MFRSPSIRRILLILGLGLAAGLFAQEEEEEISDREEPTEAMPETSDPEALRIIRGYQKTIGGKQAMESLQTLYLEGEIEEGRNTYKIQRYYQAPNHALHVRILDRRRGKEPKVYTGFDGEKAWILDPEIASNPELLRGLSEKLFQRRAALFGPLLHLEDSDFKYSLEGQSSYRGLPVNLVRVWYGDDDYEWYYFHQQNNLLILRSIKREFAGTPTFIDEVFTKYDRIGSVFYPVKTSYEVRGEKVGSLEIIDFTANPSLKTGFFAMPEVKERWLRQEN